MILHFFSRSGWEDWEVSRQPLIREKMPVLVDDDLRFEDDGVPRATVAMNRWLRELPISGAPSPKTWRAYARVLKSWSEFLDSLGIHLFAARQELRDALSCYAEHRLSGPADARWGSSSWNQAVTVLASFYRWAVEEGHAQAVPFSYAQQTVLLPDGTRVDMVRNQATVRGSNAHATRRYLERDYEALLMHALAGNTPSGDRDRSFRGRETGRNAAVVGLALSSGLRSQEFTFLTVYEVPRMPPRRTEVPLPLILAPATAKGGKGRASWIEYDDLARVWDYIDMERSLSVEQSRWRPEDALQIEEPDYEGARINGVRRRWRSLNVDERLRLVQPGGGSALLAVQTGGQPFKDWASVLGRTAARIRNRFDAAFPHIFPHLTRHTFAMRTLERLVKGYYRQAAQLEHDTGGDAALALYLTKADPLLVLRDLLGHSSVVTTQVYLHLLDTQRIYQEAAAEAAADTAATAAANAEFEGEH
ncbi:site-specific integrase [Glycomyces sp. YM15]|uniref:tyrosine-type recombinase/integrase n=1 Tax=Glycomyces sp. YM15 TaxID=2800446 RepID=UPI0019622937|nr:site-specific integrase [Glycomyces sp. YM15]